MTSEERREARYRRRVERRKKKKETFFFRIDNFDEVFSYEHLYQAYKKCRKNVSWKSSVQKYITQAPLLVWQTYNRLRQGKWKSKGFFEFDVCERGKQRHIRSVTMEERVVQRCLCDYALVPALSRSFVYDNGASLRDKGYHFTLRRLCQHLREHYRKHGNEGYVLLFDFRKFFDNISHRVCKMIQLSHGFIFIKARIYLTATGKVLRKIPKISITRERRKLKNIFPFYKSGRMTYQDVYASWQSWRSYAKNFSAWHSIQSVGRLYDELYIQSWLNEASLRCA